MPSAPTSFVGRTQELADIRRRLDAARLLTLTGPGGCGKTRLALQVTGALLPAFADGVCWCDFVSLSDPSYVPQRLAADLGLSAESGRSSVESITQALAARQMLIVFDNCEHLLGACATLAEALLRDCPQIKVLATSTQPLGLPGESVWPVPPLHCPLPPSEAGAGTAGVEQSDAVRLFVERAQQVAPSFVLNEGNAAAVATICRRLDGMPLALELAAARARVLSVEQIAERLDDSFALLTRGKFDTRPHHETLRAAMDWTYGFLSAAEQALLRRLAVFAGAFTLEMVEAICAADALDGLSGLVDKSFVSLAPHEGQAAHYRLLETIRQYAREKLEDAGEAAALRDRYLAWCVSWAEAATAHLTRAEQGLWLQQFEAQGEHFRAALRWACTRQSLEAGLRLANALLRFWLTGNMAEGRAWLEELLNLESSLREAGASPVSDATRAWALFASGRLAVRIGDDAHGARRGQESLTLFRAAGEPAGVLSALNLLALAAQDTGDYAGATALYAEALTLSRQVNDARMTMVVLVNDGLMYYEQQDFRRAAPLWEEAHAIAERNGYFASLDNLGCLAMMQGELGRAQSLLEREWQTASRTGDKHSMALALMDWGEAVRRQGELERAQALLTEALERHRQMSNSTRIGENLVYLAHLARNRGQLQEARTLYEQSLPYLQDASYTRYVSHVLLCLGGLALAQDRAADALALCGQSLQVAQKGKHRLCQAEALEEIARVRARQGQAEDAATLFAAATAERERIGAPVPPVERERYERARDALRASLGDAAYATIQARARELSLEPLVAEALGEAPVDESRAPALVRRPAPELKVYVLGPTRVLVDERVLGSGDWTYSKSKELFFYLLLNPPATKAQIGLDLWPDASAEQLRNSFHRSLHYARKALGHADWIVFEHDSYAFDRRINYWCDLHEFEARLKQAQRLLKAGMPPPAERAEARQQLAQAVGLWQGDCLADMDVGEWGILYREALRRSYTQALMELGPLYVGDAGYAEAIEVYERVLAQDSYFEAAHRELMRCHARLGEASRALRHYQSLCALLRDELGAEPSPETTLLYERLRRGDDV